MDRRRTEQRDDVVVEAIGRSDFPLRRVQLLVEPEVHRQISLVTVAGRPHSKPVAHAVRTAQTFDWTLAAAEREADDRTAGTR